MPRRINKKCVECAQLNAEQAQLLHGKDGDGCWNEKRCPRKRSHYRHRRELNEKRRLEYQHQVSGIAAEEKPVETVSLEAAKNATPYATLYIWREKRKDAPLHAISASVFAGGSKVLEIEPIHCAGFRRRQLENYIQKKVMPYLKARYGITVFSDQIRLEPIECAIEGCPLRADKAAPLERLNLLGEATDG